MVHTSLSSSPSYILHPPALRVLHCSAFTHSVSEDISTSSDCINPSFLCYIWYLCSHWRVKLRRADLIKTPPDQNTAVPDSMEAKAKTGASVPKVAPKAEKKEPVAPRKVDPAPASPEPEHPPTQDGATEAEATVAGDEASACGTDSLENLKPFLIGGAIIAAGAILLGVLILARRN